MTDPMLLTALGALALLGLVLAVKGGKNKVRKVRHGVEDTKRSIGVAGRTFLTATAIAGVQFAVVTFVTDPVTIGLVLGIPALLAGVTASRMFTVHTVVRSVRKGR